MKKGKFYSKEAPAEVFFLDFINFAFAFIYRIIVESSLKLSKPWLQSKLIYRFSRNYQKTLDQKKFMFEFVEKLAKDHEQEFPRPESAVPKVYLDHLYTIRNSMEYEEHIKGLGIFLQGSYETTGKAIPSTLLLLAMNPHIQENVVEEVKSFLSSDDDEFDEEKISNAIYLNMVIRESQRLLPAALILGRKTTEDLTLGKSL